MRTSADVERWIYSSYMAARSHIKETLDEKVRRPQFTRRILDRLGSPDRPGFNVTVTGSKGKGSTSVMLAEILRAHGWKVGLFTSPHLVRFTERIRSNGEEIPAEAFVRIGNEVKKAADPVIENLAPDEYIGPVGLATVIAALYFREQQTDVNIWECGRGALYDDVNQVTHEAAVITPVLEEHLPYLGPGLADVVKHKLGVVTPAVRQVFIGRQDERVNREIQQLTNCWQRRETVQLGRDVHVSNVNFGLEGTQFSVQTPHRFYERLNLSLLGTFQSDNAALALVTAEQIIQKLNGGICRIKHAPLDESAVRTALKGVKWPGRLELLSTEPTILVDGAIHRRSAGHVAETLSRLNSNKGTLVIGIPKDKDYRGVLEVLAPLAHRVIVTSANRDYLKFPVDALSVAKSFCSRVEFKEKAVEAFQTGLDQLLPDEWMAIVGTQSLVGVAQKFFRIKESFYERSSHRETGENVN